MKTISNRVVATLVVVILAVGPTAAARPRDHGDRGIPEKIIRIIQKVSQIFGVGSNADLIPPRP